MALIDCITWIQFDLGAIGVLGQPCDRFGILRPLVVTGRRVKSAGMIDTALGALAHAGVVALRDTAA